MKRTAALFVVGALVAAACSQGESTDVPKTQTTPAPVASSTTVSSTTTSTTTTTTQPTTTTLSDEELQSIQLEEDSKLIRQLWRDRSDSWFLGLEAGFAFLASHNYPGMECSAEDFANYYSDVEDGYFEEAVVHVDTIEPDPEWVLIDTGLRPEGRVYIHQMTATDSFNPNSTLSELHAVIIDDEAFYFSPCRDL